MQQKFWIRPLVGAVALATAAFPQQSDECTGAVPVLAGGFYLPNLNAATPSALPWSCAGPGAATPDVWYSYTSTTMVVVRASTCGSFSWDTAIEVYRGDCMGLQSIACDDNGCSSIGGSIEAAAEFLALPGVTYLLRLGGTEVFAGGFLEFTLTETTIDPPFSAECLQTALNGNNAGPVGGNVYFDLIVDGDVTITGLDTRLGANSGGPVGLIFWMTPDTYVGKETLPAAWVQAAVDDGTASVVGGPALTPTSITFATPLNLTAGTYGIALQASGARHHYSNIPLVPLTHVVNGDFSLILRAGAAQNGSFTGGLNRGRLWNGTLCAVPAAAPVGTNYCGPAAVNSTGASATIAGFGSAAVVADDLTLAGTGLPGHSFAIFLASMAQGFVANPGGSAGNLCLDGAIGRGVGGVIVNSGSAGTVEVQADLAIMPQPGALVPVLPGETWYFQCWFRDSGPSGPTSNYTDALAITFL